MSLYLRSHVHAAVIGDHVVLLDVDGDAYLCLPGAARAFEAGDRHEVAAGATATQLLAAGLAQETATGRPPRRLPPLPERTIIHDARLAPLRPQSLLAAWGACRDLERAGRTAGLTAYLALGRSAPPLERDSVGVTAAARLFWDMAPWLPIRGQCLQRSAALVSYLRRLGLGAEWVFGVRLWPFAAHCWVQCDDACLNDDVERLQAFTPILCR